MKLIFGLGNYEKRYNGTRHNVGFEYLDYYTNKRKIDFCYEKFNSKYAEIFINNEKVLLIKPMTYMNLSGEAVINFINFYKVNLDDIVIIHDDLDLELGKFKLVYDSSSGGHNGIKSIENKLNTKKYLRLKIGISSNKGVNIINYVLGNFSEDEGKIINKIYENLENFIYDYCSNSMNNLMNKYNRKDRNIGTTD